jgi:flagellar biosynthesis protein
VNIDEHIPPQLYMAIAELLAWLYRIEHGDASAPLPKLILPPT